MRIHQFFVVAVIAVISAGFAACGFADFDEIERGENASSCSEGEKCDDVASPKPPSGDHDSAVIPRGEDDSEADEELPEEPEDSDEPADTDEPDDPVSPDDFDLQCADDPAICRFCGPPVDVVYDCPDGDPSFECQVFEKVNEIRVDNGLNALDYNGTLAESAMIHAMDLNHCDYFAHDSLDGTTFFERCAENGYSGTCTGENIGGGQQSPQSVIDAWMESPGHRANILYDSHTELGVAFYEGSGNYSRYWLKHFGRD